MGVTTSRGGFPTTAFDQPSHWEDCWARGGSRCSMRFCAKHAEPSARHRARRNPKSAPAAADCLEAHFPTPTSTQTLRSSKSACASHFYKNTKFLKPRADTRSPSGTSRARPGSPLADLLDAPLRWGLSRAVHPRPKKGKPDRALITAQAGFRRVGIASRRVRGSVSNSTRHRSAMGGAGKGGSDQPARAYLKVIACAPERVHRMPQASLG